MLHRRPCAHLRILIAVLAACALAPAASARAATVDVSSGTLRYVAGAGEVNAVTITPGSGTPIWPNAPATPANP